MRMQAGRQMKQEAAQHGALTLDPRRVHARARLLVVLLAHGGAAVRFRGSPRASFAHRAWGWQQRLQAAGGGGGGR